MDEDTIEEQKLDLLTGFSLRDRLGYFLDYLIENCKLDKKEFSIVLLDINHFKKFNDKFGHTLGDEILKYFASTLRLTLDKNQCEIFRYGSDEFIVVFPHKKPKEIFWDIWRVNYNMQHRQFLFKNKFYKVTASAGISGFPHDGKTPEELIRKADVATYYSKHRGYALTTIYRKLLFFKIRNSMLVLLSIFIVAWAFLILYKINYKKTVIPFIQQAKNLIVVVKPENLDVVVLKNGGVLEGYVVSEIGDRVMFNLYLRHGEGSTVIYKSEIARIKYGSRKKPAE